MGRKLLDFQARISDVKQVNPLFSTCKVRVLYLGRNTNMSILTRDSVEKALPTLKNIPIVGEYSLENNDYKGHGGTIDLDSYKFIHTTKPYGVVPESATYSWEEYNGREYLTIEGCYLWTGRYEEANDIIDGNKSQSMEIEVTDGSWVEEEDAYRIDSFIFSALCILGDDVQPAFEGASVTGYSLDKDTFKKEFSSMLDELEKSLSKKEEEESMIKELLKKYSLTIEELTEKGINFKEISEDELEGKIVELFEINKDVKDEGDKGVKDEDVKDVKDEGSKKDEEGNKDVKDEDAKKDEGSELEDKVEKLELELEEANKSLEYANKSVESLSLEVKDLREFKLNVDKENHESKVQELFNNFQLEAIDVKDLDIHQFSVEEIEEKCYAIIGKKMAKRNFSKSKDTKIVLPVNNEVSEEGDEPYGGLIERYKNK